MAKSKHPLDLPPHLKKLNDEVLFGDVWENPDLSKRDHRLIARAVLTAPYRTKEFEFHLDFAIKNGVAKDELLAMITPVTFHSGRPTAVNAGRVALDVLGNDDDCKGLPTGPGIMKGY